jgi:hypothetical protein
MNDIVSIRKIPSVSLSLGRSRTGVGPGATLVGDDFFFAGNHSILTVERITWDGEVSGLQEKNSADFGRLIL